MRKKADNKQKKSPLKDDIENIVFMEHLSSCEFYLEDGETPRLVLRDVGLLFQKGQTWGITGNSLFEIKLLTEIIANIKPYRSGNCVLVERGMMRHKRLILPHVFYIGSSEMLYNNMTVLEFLMFATDKMPGNKREHQERLLEYLISIGLKRIALTSIYKLSREQKAVIILLVAAYSKSKLIVYNLPDYSFDETLLGAMKQMMQLITEKGETLVIATSSPGLIEEVCSHILFLRNGTVFYQGPVHDFCHKYDRIILTIQGSNIKSIAVILKTMLPCYQYDIKGDNLIVSARQATKENPELVCKKIVETGFIPERIEVNFKNVKNAYEEIIRNHDL